MIARTGAEVCCGFNSSQSFNYDSTSDLFTYSAIGQQRYAAPGLADQLFQSAFTWTANIDEPGLGRTNGGAMQWFGDFGSGLQLIASGDVKDLGFGAANPPGGSGPWTFLGMQVLLANSLPGAAIDLGREFILNMELVLETPFDSPFKEDFSCCAHVRQLLVAIHTSRRSGRRASHRCACAPGPRPARHASPQAATARYSTR